MSTQKIKLDFRAIPNGKFSIKTLTLINKTKEKQQYQTSRHPDTNPLDYVFDIEPKTPILEPGESCIVKLQYAPEVPFYTNVDYFSVYDASGECHNIHTRGESLGPRVVASANKIIFIATPENPNVRRFELKNGSKIQAPYQIDIDLDQCVFKPDKLSGTIGPESRTFVTITFSPPKPGVYQKNMVVLVHYQNTPILITLEGVSKPCTSKNKLKDKDKALKIVHYSREDARRESGEVIALTDETQPPPLTISPTHLTISPTHLAISPTHLTISPTHLDFGATDVDADQSNVEPVVVTNRSTDDILLKWDEDKKEMFFIEPPSEIIPGGQSITFHASFRPARRDQLFAAELEARGYWHQTSEDAVLKDTKDELEVYVPLLLSLRVMGHSFPAGGYGWMPQYRMCPPSVTLPPCCPSVPVYTTFLIERFGHLPITFRFIPPEFTFIKLSPMQGLIDGDRQIVGVELTPAPEGERGYMERWTVQFNGSPKHEVPMDFRGFAECPYVKVGQENIIRIPATYRGAERRVSVPMRNLSRHCIRFKYILFGHSDTITFTPSVGNIAPNDTVHHELLYSSENIGVQKMRIQVEIVALHDGRLPIGSPVTINSVILVECVMVTLVSIPKYIDCGMILLGQPINSRFHLFNFGTCPVHFQLRCEQRNVVLVECDGDVMLSPPAGTVPADSSVQIGVSVCPSQLGLQQFEISYHSTRDGYTLTDEAWMDVVHVDYEGVTPSMTIRDLKLKCAGPLFTKVCMWKMLQIKEFNEALRLGLPDTEADVNMYFPEAPVGTHELTVYLYLKSNCFFPTEWSLQRLRSCSCKRVPRTLGQSASFNGFNCPHRSLLTMSPTNGTLEPKKWLVVEIVAKYDLEGSWELSYVFELPNERKIFIHAHIVAYAASKPVLSMYTPALELSNTFVGDLYPATQMFWLYNNSLQDAKYFVDTLPLRTLMINEFRIPVLKCLNPKGVVKAKSNQAIYFKFNPYEFKNYQVQLPLNLGNAPINNTLNVSGDGVVHFDSHVRFLHDRAPSDNVTDTPEIPILFSSDNIIIKPFPTNSQVERILFMKNQTDLSYEYTWHEYKLKNLLRVTVSPATGILKPRETHVCKMVLESSSDPCIITARIHLEAVNIHDKCKHEKSLMVYQAMETEMEDEFIITKTGYSKLTPDMKIYPMPEPLDMAVAVVCHIYNPVDPDVKFTLTQQMKQRPDPGLQCLGRVKSTTGPKTRQEQNAIIASFENAIWDAISSKWFERNLEKLHNECKPYYSQFIKHDKENEKLKKDTYNIAPNYLTNNLITDLAYNLMQEMFDFDVVNKTTILQRKEAARMEEDMHVGENKTKNTTRIKVPFAW